MSHAWKAFERRACRDMGVERRGPCRERHGADNAAHAKFAFQFKLRRGLPAWLFDWLAGIVATAAREGKIGALVLKRPAMLDGDAIVLLRWRDWVTLHGPVAFGDGAHRLEPRSTSKTDTEPVLPGMR